MQIIKIIAYVCFGLAGLFVISAIAMGELALVAVVTLSMSVAVMGALLLALDKIISTLIEIRDAVVGSGIEPTEVTVQPTSVDND